MRRRNKKAQSFMEYAVLIVVVVAALVAMRIFMARAVQEKFRQAADAFGQGEQYQRGATVESDVR